MATAAIRAVVGEEFVGGRPSAKERQMNPEVREAVEEQLRYLEADQAAVLHLDVERPAETVARRFIIDAIREALDNQLVVCVYCEENPCGCDDD
jgi:hypothetical protein